MDCRGERRESRSAWWKHCNECDLSQARALGIPKWDRHLTNRVVELTGWAGGNTELPFAEVKRGWFGAT